MRDERFETTVDIVRIQDALAEAAHASRAVLKKIEHAEKVLRAEVIRRSPVPPVPAAHAYDEPWGDEDDGC